MNCLCGKRLKIQIKYWKTKRRGKEVINKQRLINKTCGDPECIRRLKEKSNHTGLYPYWELSQDFLKSPHNKGFDLYGELK